MADPFIGEIRIFGGNFAPRGYAFAQGQTLPISQFDALFALIGTTYGGDGQTTFNLPDLRGRVPVHQGTGAGLAPKTIGEQAGTETVTVLTSQIPAHTHPVVATGANASLPGPGGNSWAYDGGGLTAGFSAPANANGVMNPACIGPTGGSQPHNNMQPFLAISYIVALEGVFPSRN